MKLIVDEKSLDSWLASGDGPFNMTELKQDLIDLPEGINLIKLGRAVSPILKKKGYVNTFFTINGKVHKMWIEASKVEPGSQWLKATGNDCGRKVFKLPA